MAERKYDGADKRGFHFDKSISLGHVLQMIVIGGAVVGAYISMQDRITKLEVMQVYTEKTMTTIAGTIADISRKLDR